MDFIKKFAKELSVFGIVLVIFIGLFIYRQATFKDYKTISESQLTSMVEDKDSFVLVVGDSTDTTVLGFQEVMQTYTTRNRSTDIYYVDSSTNEDFDSYLEKTLDINVTYPATIIVKDGEVAARKEGAIQYYALLDFIEENS